MLELITEDGDIPAHDPTLNWSSMPAAYRRHLDELAHLVIELAFTNPQDEFDRLVDEFISQGRQHRKLSF